MTTPAIPVQSYGAINNTSVDPETNERVPLIVAFDPDDEYPDATNEQKDVLKLMDGCIREMKKSGSDVVVQIPPLETSQVAAMRYPMHPTLRAPYMLCRSWCGKTLLTFLLSVVLCLATWWYFDSFRVDNLLSEHEFLQYVLPGLVAVVATLVASGPMRHRLWGYAREVAFWNQPRKVKNAVAETVEDQVLLEVATKIDTIHLRLTMVLDQISNRARTIQSPRDRKRLMKVDPTLPDIPVDTDRLEQDLLGAKSELQGSVMQFLQDLSLDEINAWTPEWLRDAKLYYRRAKNGNLAMLLLLQLILSYGTYWGFFLYMPGAEEEYAEPYVELGEEEIDLLASSSGVLASAFAVEDYVTTQILAWSLLLSFEAYILSSVYTTTVFALKTSARKTSRLCTKFRTTTLTTKTNEALQHSGIQFLCRDILEFRMEKTKRQLLKLISYNNRIDRMREAVDGDAMSVTTASTGFSLASFSPSAPLSGSPVEAKPSAPREDSLPNRFQNTFSSWRRKPSLEARNSAARKTFSNELEIQQ